MTNPFEQSEFSTLVELLELQLEGRISPAQFEQLEETVRTSSQARQFYLQYVDLHGALHWDLALTAETDKVSSASAADRDSAGSEVAVHESSAYQRRARRTAVVASACCLVVLLLIFGVFDALMKSDADTIVDSTSGDDGVPQVDPGHTDSLVAVEGLSPRVLKPAQLPGMNRKSNVPDRTVFTENTKEPDENQRPESRDSVVSTGAGSSETVVARIDRFIRSGWTDNEVAPSERADDSEWLRRVYLDTVGHIPPVDEVRSFLADDRPDKRAIVVDALLDDEDYIRNWTTVWTNLLIGRSNPREVNRPALQKFLRESFAENRGWDDIVTDFIAAEGSHDENGATNFLLAHVNNQAVPATAITGQVFLGLQLQCTQCHNHPFNNQKQDEFWAFNSFFKQIKVQDEPAPGNPRVRKVALLNTSMGGATFYETRQGVMKAVFPRFEGRSIDAGDYVDRRAELAKLMTEGESPQIARAFVNRMWQHFFGAAFTPQVDDMGPHVAVSHPELLDELTREFVRSGYDTRQLIRWICNSEAYNLTSRFSADGSNVGDDPSLGNEPLFSRVYVKQMTVEQLFDSLLVATQAHEVFGTTWDAVAERRQQWLQQFVMAWNTDENDEANLFDGTIPQALMMMNGDLVDLALEADRGTLLSKVARSDVSEKEKIETIALAALSRLPGREESATVRRLIRDSVSRNARPAEQQLAMRAGLQDLFWACLNSNEFILVH